MSSRSRRITFIISPEMEPIIKKAKRIFFDISLSEMVRILVLAGYEAYAKEAENEEAGKEDI